MKLPISQSTVAVTNIQALPDVVVGDATNLKATFDKTGLDEKNYINTVLISELNGDDGSKKIGHNSTNLGSDNVADALEEVRLIAVQAQAGDILPNSITNTELGVDVKVGSLASLTTAEKSSVVGAINEINGDVTTLSGSISSLTTSLGIVKTDLNIVRTAKTTTGSAVALAVDTDGTFDLTRNGNILTVIPNVTNTGSVTINIDGQGAKTIKKANDSGTLVNLEAGDIKINVPTQLVRDTVSDFFVYAPKGGSNPIKSWSNNTVFSDSDSSGNAVTQRINLTGKGWILAIGSDVDGNFRLDIDGVQKIPTSGTSQSIRTSTNRFLMIRFNSNFTFYSSTTGNIKLIYLVGDKYEDSILNYYTPDATTDSLTLRNTVTGKGWIYGIKTSTPTAEEYTKLTIDGSVRILKKVKGDTTLLVRFTQGFTYETRFGFQPILYVLD